MNIDPNDVPRRGFWPQALAILTGAVTVITPAVVAIGFLLHPIRRQAAGAQATATDGYFPLPIGPDALAADGTPQSCTIIADIVDAWNFYPQQPMGKVWLRKGADGSIAAFNMTCPHLGCDIDFRSAQDDFFCPCHASTFGLDGDRRNQIPPRDMDALETKVVDGKIFVRYQNFRGGITEKEFI